MDELLTSNEIYNKFSNDVELEKYNNVLGTYNTDDFTIRLAYYIHEKLDHLNAGVINGSDIDDETLQAYSTFLHETIHWRQHIGSIAGFILSMKTPAQNFCLQHFLKIILEEIGPVKSLKKFYINNVKTNTPTDRLFQNLNNILNNFYDLKYYTYLVINPKIITDNINMHEDFFLTYGHSTVYAYINFLEIFSGYFREDQYINEKIKKLKNVIYTQEKSPHKEFNAFKKGQFVIPPIGLKQIFEGQARFIQLQFLYFANKKKFDMQFFHDTKLLTGVYGEAFDLYISIIGYDYPLSFGSHLISIFLVICDLAINPGVAFPLDVGHEESFFFEAIPGLRFYDLCHAAKELIAIDPKFTVCNHSKSEYYYIANTLCDKLCYNNPIEIIDEVLSWAQRYESIRNIQDEEKTYSFSKELLPIRFLLSKFILICEDKKKSSRVLLLDWCL
ncbi:hypothetical protein [Escherichia coli]|uniref:hypothetical protein n=1 Tax=Escherichia coli TaxID=562 RepID=UPI00199D8262|nr:hypothetical protein [Escherichia coli]EGD5120678.1 hypothetical protein [Escherichia coli]HBA6592787.1 hypothetical protein [Escherichia coli]